MEGMGVECGVFVTNSCVRVDMRRVGGLWVLLLRCVGAKDWDLDLFLFKSLVNDDLALLAKPPVGPVVAAPDTYELVWPEAVVVVSAQNSSLASVALMAYYSDTRQVGIASICN